MRKKIKREYEVTAYKKIEGDNTDIWAVKRLKDGEVFSIGDKIVTIYKSPAIKPLIVEQILLDKQVSGGIALIGQGRVCSIRIAKHYTESV